MLILNYFWSHGPSWLRRSWYSTTIFFFLICELSWILGIKTSAFLCGFLLPSPLFWNSLYFLLGPIFFHTPPPVILFLFKDGSNGLATLPVGLVRKWTQQISLEFELNSPISFSASISLTPPTHLFYIIMSRVQIIIYKIRILQIFIIRY